MPPFTFKLTIMNPEKTIFEGSAKSVFLDGDKAEYELLPYHSPTIGVLKEGEIIIDNEKSLPIKQGIVRFYNNECLILAEQK